MTIRLIDRTKWRPYCLIMETDAILTPYWPGPMLDTALAVTLCITKMMEK